MKRHQSMHANQPQSPESDPALDPSSSASTYLRTAMSHSPQPTPVDAQALSRRELQYLARELELCRGNAKSDVIVEHVVALMASSEGAARVQKAMNDMPDDIKSRTPGPATPAKRAREAARETAEETPRRSSRRSAEVTPAATEPQQSDSTAEHKERRTSSLAGRKVDFETEENDDPVQEQPASTKAPKKAKTEQPVATAAAVKVATPAKKSPAKKSPAKSPVTKPVSTPEPVAATKVTKTTPVKSTGRSPLANVSNVAQPAKATPSSVEALVNSTADLAFVGSERVKCTTTGHEMKADYDVITAYMAGKRYQRAHTQKQSFTSFAPMFVDHPDEKKTHMVWCSVTQTAIARDVARIEAHMEGPRYQKELPQWEADQKAAAVEAALAAEKQAARAKAIAAKSQAAATKTSSSKSSKKRQSEAITGDARGKRVKVAADNV